MSQARLTHLNQALTASRLWLAGLLIALVASFFCWTGSAEAANTIILHFRDRQVAVSNQEFIAFATGGAVSEDLQTFFQSIDLTPQDARDLLSETILPSIDLKLDADLNQFLALQLNKLIGSPNEAESLDALEQVVVSALADDRSFSILELINEYPKSTLNVYLARLERVQNEVDLFVERVSPLLQQAEGLLADLVCQCETEPSGPALLAPPQAAAPAGTVQFVSCVQPAMGVWQQPALPQTPLLLVASTVSPSPRPKQVVITYGPLGRSLSVEDLTRLAETGAVSRSLKANLRLAKISPEQFRSILTQTVKVDAGFLDKNLNNVLGEFALFEIGKIVHTGSRRANIQALRSALMASVQDDNQISLLEFLQNYPLAQVYIDGAKLVKLSGLANPSTREAFAISEAQRLEDFFIGLQTAVAAEVCSCQNSPAST